MSRAIDVALERIRQQLTRDRGIVGTKPRVPLSAEDRLGLAFTPGERVRDLVTGEEGTLVAGKRHTVIVPVAK